jgi:hypothetical protein
MNEAPTRRQPFPSATLNAAGLNRQAVFDLTDLPADMQAKLAELEAGLAAFRQLILIGHGGRQLWDCVQRADIRSDDPIDDFTCQTLADFFANELPQQRFQRLYPGPHPIGLQPLGALAGWHHASPFMVGIDPTWGSWSAYRAVILSDTDFAPTQRVDRSSPCATCIDPPCIRHCPVDALAGARFNLARCTAGRIQTDSPCQERCLARLACPISAEHRYTDAQIRHSYSRSLAMIRQYASPT